MKVINCAPKMIMVDGVIVANTFTQFVKWLIKNKVSMAEFKNWPFTFGLSSDLETKKVHFYMEY